MSTSQPSMILLLRLTYVFVYSSVSDSTIVVAQQYEEIFLAINILPYFVMLTSVGLCWQAMQVDLPSNLI